MPSAAAAAAAPTVAAAGEENDLPLSEASCVGDGGRAWGVQGGGGSVRAADRHLCVRAGGVCSLAKLVFFPPRVQALWLGLEEKKRGKLNGMVGVERQDNKNIRTK